MTHENEVELTQHLASNATAHQNYYDGREHQIVNGSGTINNYNGAYPYMHESRDKEIREKIIQALYTSPYLQRKNRNPDRVPGTCKWFLNHDEFHRWRDSTSSSMLWVSANPGCGKSVLAKCLVDELETTAERTTCYFFFKDDFEDQRSAKGALSCILHQLFVQRENLLSPDILDRFSSYRAPLANKYYDLGELWKILIMASQKESAGEIICILDAFDECENQDRQELAKLVRNFYVQNGSTKQSVNLKFLITSRPYDNFRRDLVPFDLEDVPVIHLKGDNDKEGEKIADEIGLFIKHRVSRIRDNLELTNKEEKLLLQGLEAVPNQTYLWIYLTLDWIETEIHNKISETKIRNAISVLPRTVDEAYDRILAKSTDVAETKKLLHIVVAAERPLTLEEMKFALALQPHHRSYQDLEQRPSDRFRKYIRDLCGLFINIQDGKIYLLHQTAKEFLVPKGHQNSQHGIKIQRADSSQVDRYEQITWRGSLLLSESHRILFQICVWHLLFTEFEMYPLTAQSKTIDNMYLRDNVFIEYSAKNWATHFRAAGIERAEFREQLQQICDPDSPRCTTWLRVFWTDMPATLDTGDVSSKVMALMVASCFGIKPIVKIEFEWCGVKFDVNDIGWRLVLSQASENYFESITKLLGKSSKFMSKTFIHNARGRVLFEVRTFNSRDTTKYAARIKHAKAMNRDFVRVVVKPGARADLCAKIGGGFAIYEIEVDKTRYM